MFVGVLSLGFARDVFLDLATPIYNVIVQNPSMGAEERDGIAIPFEVALAGLPDVRRIGPTRSSVSCR